MFGGDAGKERLMCVVEEVEGWRGWMYRGGWRWMAMIYRARVDREIVIGQG